MKKCAKTKLFLPSRAQASPCILKELSPMHDTPSLVWMTWNRTCVVYVCMHVWERERGGVYHIK